VTTHRGTTVELLEPDYLFGAGLLRLRIEHIDVAERVRYDGDDWVAVEGVELSAAGRERGRRRVLVRARRLSIP
jgi:hypothetical protein